MRATSAQLSFSGLLALALACGGESATGPGTGTIEITTTTVGVEADPDGYMVQVDAGEPHAIGAGATTQVTDVAVGDHAVLLVGLASNCAVEGENPSGVTMDAGQTASVSFTVRCAPTTGGVQVTAATTGPAPDADGYTLTADGSEKGTLGANAALPLEGLSPGEHAIGLGGVAANCQVQGENPRTVNVAAGASLELTFAVVCSTPAPGSGTLRIQTTTTGPDADPNGYTFAVDAGTSQPIAVSGTNSLSNVAAGSHSVQLSSLAQNCAVEGQNPRPVTLEGGATASVTFSVACSATSGTIRVSVNTTGGPTDPDGYGVKIDNQSRRTLATTGSTSIPAPAGTRTVELTGVAPNCQVADGRSRPVSVEVGAVQEVSFAVACMATTGSIQVSVTSSGSPPDGGYTVDLDDGGASQPIGINGTTTFAGVSAGGHTVTVLAALNCTVPEGAERFVTVTAGSTAELSLAVTCSLPSEAWTALALPAGFRGSAIWATSASDIFVTGASEGSSDGVILHHDGQSWTEQFRANQVLLGGLWGSSATEVFAAGNPTAGSTSPGLVLRYNGSQWSDVGPTEEFDHYLAVWGTSATDLFAAGWFDAIPGNGLIRHYNGTEWAAMTDHGFGTNGQITDLTGSSATDVYALGSESTFGTEPSVTTSAIARYDGSGWTRSFATTEYQLNGVLAAGPNDAFAVANDGYIFHFDGAVWTQMLSPTGHNLQDVWGRSGTDVYAVGDGGILHYDGSTWSFSSTVPGTRVWGTASEVFVLTNNSVLRKSGL
ncbi:MAG: hypothetical protein ACR2HW_06735 [Gemmatimonadales bacterium]